ncbi:uncharacterized protein B0J16DRAFT_344765 [Fusarium flagelliforme]|uniref:uncharacterized protein n=1 Tax=Fusarium flagelliforme TaxID=2675880 RepID=UPI001E8EDC58|nr:uncharacterized protein B0J16DRAFT_344765 [Fusarium flagelliforme]KAH7182868.1 hypothetical protein B0J16DRAFT_344765 [Fusarium flagelliforme]
MSRILYVYVAALASNIYTVPFLHHLSMVAYCEQSTALRMKHCSYSCLPLFVYILTLAALMLPIRQANKADGNQIDRVDVLPKSDSFKLESHIIDIESHKMCSRPCELTGFII